MPQADLHISQGHVRGGEGPRGKQAVSNGNSSSLSAPLNLVSQIGPSRPLCAGIPLAPRPEPSQARAIPSVTARPTRGRGRWAEEA